MFSSKDQTTAPKIQAEKKNPIIQFFGHKKQQFMRNTIDSRDMAAFLSV